MKLDLKGFKKIESDEHHTILEHEKGHQIKVAHSGLSKEFKSELDNLPVHKAKGGYSRYAQKFDPNYQRKLRESKASKPSKALPPTAYTPPKEAKHAYTEPDNIGSTEAQDIVLKSLNKQAPPFGPMSAEKPHYPPCVNPSCKSFGRSHPNCRCYGGVGGEASKAGMFAEGGEVDNFCSQDRKHKKGCEYYAEGENVGSDSALNQALEAGPDQTPMPAQGPIEQPIEQNVEPQQELPLTPQEHVQQQTQDLLNEDAAIQSDINAGHITPETYSDLFGKKDTLGKIGTLFGLMVGGIGSGLSRQPNMLMEMMNKEIQNDLQAQQHSAENRQNLLRINQSAITSRAQAHLTEAEARAKNIATSNIQANRLAFDSLVQARSKIPDGTPQAQAYDQALTIMKPMVDKEALSIAAKYGLASAVQRFGMGGGKNNMSAPAPQKQHPKSAPAKSASAAVVPKKSPGFWDNVHNQGFFSAITPYLPTGDAKASVPSPQQEEATEEPPEVSIPQFNVDEEGVKRSQFLGSSGDIPGQINPGEIGQANEEMGKAHQFNDKIKLIHQNFGELWKNRSDANQALKYLSSLGVNLEGIHIQPPDFTTWTEGSKNYFRAANRIRQELGVLVGNGALTHEQAESVLTNLIKQNDTPDDYKNILQQVDGNLMSNLRTPVLEKYGKIVRPKISE